MPVQQRTHSTRTKQEQLHKPLAASFGSFLRLIDRTGMKRYPAGKFVPRRKGDVWDNRAFLSVNKRALVVAGEERGLHSRFLGRANVSGKVVPDKKRLRRENLIFIQRVEELSEQERMRFGHAVLEREKCQVSVEEPEVIITRAGALIAQEKRQVDERVELRV